MKLSDFEEKVLSKWNYYILTIFIIDIKYIKFKF